MERIEAWDISKCIFCKYRNSSSCGDGRPYQENGCDDFEIDMKTLTREEQRLFFLARILMGEQNERD